jgi:hypothetical protein
MPIKFLIPILVFGFFMVVDLKGQTNKPAYERRPNIVLHTFDKKKYKARLKEVGENYLLVNAAPYQTPAELNVYYMRHSGDYFKVDVEYIVAVGTRRGRAVKNAALGGGITVGLIVAPLVYQGAQMEGDEFFPSIWKSALGGGIGFVVGGFVGAIGGMFSRKHINIYGLPENLSLVSAYYDK